MQYRRLGSAGVKLSVIGLGNWLTHSHGIEDDRARECTRRAFDLGINFFDTADVYNYGGAEEFWGRELKAFRRQDLVLATKVFFPLSDNINNCGLSRKHIRESVEQSLRRLQTDYIDLYQCHRFDPDVPMAEIVRTMDDLIRAGRILYWGVSEWPALEIKNACALARQMGACPPVSNQPEYSIAARRVETNGVQNACVQEQLGMVVWSPLKQGLLTGKYSGGKAPPDSRAASQKMSGFMPELKPELVQPIEQLRPIASSRKCTMAQLALAWVLQRPAMTSAIVGVTRVEQLEENVAAAGITLGEGELKHIDELFPASRWQ